MDIVRLGKEDSGGRGPAGIRMASSVFTKRPAAMGAFSASAPSPALSLGAIFCGIDEQSLDEGMHLAAILPRGISPPMSF